ncbi:MAG TPA: uroporphyrinogen-III synthase [Sulfurimonas sp. UBA12504]|nr:MAG TPA: uroporphyrinogen-III synthase [Sulfurimonas sp. UBA12504]
MKNYTNLFEPLNLIYYEYDVSVNTLYIDMEQPSSYYSMELVSITNLLQNKGIKYQIDMKKNVVLTSDTSLFSSIKRFIHSIYSDMKYKNKNIYILSDKKVKYAKNLPMFEIKPLYKKIDFASYDALIFTSKNALYAINELDVEWKNKPAYAISTQTAKIVKSLKGNLRFVGKSNHGNSFAHELIPLLQGKKVLYLGAKEIVSDLIKILNENAVICDVEAIYETVCKNYREKIVLPKNATIIFSSPSTIKCFLQNSQWDESYKAVAIGETTAKRFPSYISAHVAQTTSLESCVRKALEINR